MVKEEKRGEKREEKGQRDKGTEATLKSIPEVKS